MRRWWAGLSRRGKVGTIAIVAVVLVVLGAAGGGGKTSSPPAPAASPPVAAVFTPSAAPAVPTGATSPGPSLNPHALTVANVTQSIHDNEGLVPSVYANFDQLQVSIPQPAEVDISVKPSLLPGENFILDYAGADALVDAKAIFGWYPTVRLVRTDVMADYQDNYGHTSTLVAAEVDITSATAQKFDYAGMAQMDPTQVICDSDHYFIHPGDWNSIKASDRGCLTAPSN